MPAQPQWTSDYASRYRILVCGGRDYGDVVSVDRALDVFRCSSLLLIHGGARGADDLAGRWASSHGYGCIVCPADWETHGKSAGYIRNKYMLQEFRPRLVLVFPGGRGTENMIQLALNDGVPVFRVM